MDIWNQFLETLEIEFGKETIDHWLRSLKCIQSDQKNIWFEAPTSFQVLWFEEHIRRRLSSLHLPNDKDSPIQVHLSTAEELEVERQKKRAQKRTKADANRLLAPSPFGKKRKAPLPATSFRPEFPDLDPTATFHSFIETTENSIVVKLIDEMCGHLHRKRLESITPSKSLYENSAIQKTDHFAIPNPIYIWGGPGSGKSHLLQATAFRLRQSGLSVIMASSDLFTEHVIRSIRAGEMSTFRWVWRNVDVLIVDDIHLFSRKQATQEEFFHTFNTLHTAGKQIILSASCLPQQLQHIESRLISRFEWGIVLQVESLTKKELPALLSAKATLMNFPLSEKQIDFLSTLLPNSVKSTVKGLDALILRASLSHREPRSLSLSIIKDLLQDLIHEEEKSALTAKKIISFVAEHVGIPYEEIIGKSQSRESVVPRQLSMYLIRKHLKIPYMKIGDIFGKDHSTVMSSIRQIEKQISISGTEIGASLASIEMLFSDPH